MMTNPEIKSFWDSLPVWDGTDYLTEFVDSLPLKEGTERERTWRNLTQWLTDVYLNSIGATLNDRCLIVEGPDGSICNQLYKMLMPMNSMIGAYDWNQNKWPILGKPILWNIDDWLETMTRDFYYEFVCLLRSSEFQDRPPYVKFVTTCVRSVSFMGTSQNRDWMDPAHKDYFLFLPIEGRSFESWPSDKVSQMWSQVKALATP